MSRSLSKVRIFVSCHKPSDFVKDEVFVPIKVGAAINKRKIPGAKSDNTGDNISELNPRFCELTAQYWAWKNYDAQYYGFFHYRRYLSFKDIGTSRRNIWGCVDADYLNKKNVERYGFNSKDIESLVNEYDIILPEKRHLHEMPFMGDNLSEQYLSSGFLHKGDLDIMLDVLKEKYPEYMPYANKYLSGKTTYFNNMFIMKKEVFHEYCGWLFDILMECDKRIDYTDYSTEAIRTPGHLAERLLNIYLLRLKDIKQYKIKELPLVVFNRTDPLEDVRPAFKKNNIPITLSANDYYVPYIATAINSIIQNSSKKNNYDILILNKDISKTNELRLGRLVEELPNFSIRFIDIGRFNDDFSSLFLHGHFTIETWFRLLMPELLSDYDKVLYIDADLVVNADVAELYHTDLDGYLLGACHDADTAGLYNGFEENKKEYTDKVLKLKNPYDYFQAGVILFNLSAFRKAYSSQEMLELAASRQWELLDQDVLNILAEGKVKYLDMSWNVMFDWRHMRRAEIISRAPKYLCDAWDKAHARPKIIHFAGPDKPWTDPMSDYADIFWKYARGSLYYEEILRRLSLIRPLQKREVNIAKRAARKSADKIFPVGTARRMRAIRFYLKTRKRI